MLNKILILCLGLFSVLSWADKPLIKLSTLDWPPYIAEKLDPESGKKGYVYDIIQAVMKEAGYEVQILFFPWARTVSAAKAGETDGYFPEYFVAHDWCKLSDAFPGGPLGLYKRKDFRIAFSVDPRMNQEQALKDLKQYNFGVVRDYVNTEVFDKANYLKKEESVSDENNLRKLSNRRIDFVVIDKYVARYLLAKPLLKIFSEDLEFMEPALEEKALYVNFSKKSKHYPKVVDDFNAALKKLMAEGKIKAILEDYGF